MTRRRLDPLWILLVACVIFFTNLGATALWDEDEPWFASCAREMLERGDWVVPMFNGETFFDKPPLMFWTMIAGFKIFGIGELGARFFSAVFGTMTALMVYYLGRLLFNSRVGLWAGLMTASSIIFTVSARAATVDAALACVTTGALLCFVTLLKRGKGRGARVQGSGFRVQDSAFNDRNNRLAAAGTAAQIEPSCPLPTAPCPLPTHNAPFAICNYLLWIILYAFLGLAILAKGPVGFLLPAASIGLFLMILNHRQEALLLFRSSGFGTDAKSKWKIRWKSFFRFLSPGNFFRSLWAMRPLTGVVVLLAVALPWYILVTYRTDGLWLEQFLAKYNLRPFVQPILGHSGPFWYYVPALLIGFFPWSIFLGPAAIDVVRRIRKGTVPIFAQRKWDCPPPASSVEQVANLPDTVSRQEAFPADWQSAPPFPERDGLILLLCWFDVSFVFWSICSTKLPHYLLPVYPALALLVGCFLEGWVAEPARVARGWLRAAWLSAVLAGVGMMAAIPIVTHIFAPGEEWLGAIGLILVLGGGIGWWLSQRRRPLGALSVYAATATVFLTALFGFAALRIDRHQNARSLIAAIRRDSPGPASLCAYRFLRRSTIFYAGHSISICHGPEQLQTLLDSAGRIYIITLDKYAKEIQSQHPGRFHVLTRQRRFLAHDQMVVLARIEAPSSVRTAASPRWTKE